MILYKKIYQLAALKSGRGTLFALIGRIENVVWTNTASLKTSENLWRLMLVMMRQTGKWKFPERNTMCFNLLRHDINVWMLHANLSADNSIHKNIRPIFLPQKNSQTIRFSCKIKTYDADFNDPRNNAKNRTTKRQRQKTFPQSLNI